MLEPLFSLRNEAEFYHRQLSDEARQFLHDRGITHAVIDLHCLGWNGSAITIPVGNRSREIVSLLRIPIAGEKDQSDTDAAQELYGWDTLARQPSRLVVTDTPLDRLILEAHGFPAVALPRHLNSLRAEWTEAFSRIEKVYVTSEHLMTLLPKRLRLVPLPDGTKDVEDFFARLGKKPRFRAPLESR